MKVQDVMTETVKTCQPDTNLAEAVAFMWGGDCGTLPVLADDGRLVGILTDRDIAMALGTRDKPASEIAVSEVMTDQVYACHPENDIHAALKMMRKDKVRRLPVVSDDGVLQGILSMNDVVLHAEKANGRKTNGLNYEDVVNTFKAIFEHRHPKPEKQPAYSTATP